jgi:hypothetical protein
MYLRISRFDQTLHLLSREVLQWGVPAGDVAAPSIFWDEWSARQFFNQHFHAPHDISRLRAALAHEVIDITRMRDEDVLSAAARRLASGAWRTAHNPARPAAAGGASAAAPPSPASRGASTAGRTARLESPRPQPAPPRAAPAPASTTPPARTRDWAEDSDQLAFAEVLEQAAQSGTPFCEICAARARSGAMPA